MSTTNKNFAAAMRQLEEEDPTTYEAINKKIHALKAEAASWRRKTLNTSSSLVTEDQKKPLTGVR